MPIFTDRVELKYYLEPARAQAFVTELGKRIAMHRFGGPGANTLPRPVHYVTTLYFDTSARDIARACALESDSVKLRVREYYDEHPELAELATSRAEMSREARLLWLEIKTHGKAHTRKTRLSFERGRLGQVLADALAGGGPGEGARSALASDLDHQLDQLRERCRGPLRPSCVAHYRRRAWQSDSGELRITLDSSLRFFPAPADMLERGLSLRDLSRAEPAGALASYLVEVKMVCDTPTWLASLARAAGLELATAHGRRFSKFLAASEAVHGLP